MSRIFALLLIGTSLAVAVSEPAVWDSEIVERNSSFHQPIPFPKHAPIIHLYPHEPREVPGQDWQAFKDALSLQLDHVDAAFGDAVSLLRTIQANEQLQGRIPTTSVPDLHRLMCIVSQIKTAQSELHKLLELQDSVTVDLEYHDERAKDRRDIVEGLRRVTMSMDTLESATNKLATNMGSLAEAIDLDAYCSDPS